jgi:tRNA-2-methylthio-N6-dimethylallyladenosine synthase
MEKRIFLRTFGCQMNKYDSGVMAECLTRDGYALTDSEKDADVILLNTCSVRERAETRVEGIIGQIKPLKRSNPDLVLGVCGCMAQKEGRKLVEKFPQIDLVCGTHRFGEIARIVRQAIENGKPVVDIGEDGEEMRTFSRASPSTKHWRASLPLQKATGVCAWVSVMRGCDSYCSYCVVPYLRGRERSRPPAEILREIEHLAESGVKEVCLLGQNIVAYGKGLDEKIDFAELLGKVNGVGGIFRIRFLTSHPRDVGEKLFERISRLERVCENLHLPFQAGSDKILKLMNRGYTRDYYRKLIEKARSLMPEAGITSDIIVGFPGETDENFKKTRELMEEIKFDDCFIYKYSPRPRTKASSMDGQVENGVKQERLEELLELQTNISARKNEKLMGAEVEILVEEISKKDSSSVYGRTRSDKNVVFKGGNELIGELVNVRIEKTGPATLVGSGKF